MPVDNDLWCTGRHGSYVSWIGPRFFSGRAASLGLDVEPSRQDRSACRETPERACDSGSAATIEDP